MDEAVLRAIAKWLDVAAGTRSRYARLRNGRLTFGV